MQRVGQSNFVIFKKELINSNLKINIYFRLRFIGLNSICQNAQSNNLSWQMISLYLQ